MSEFILRAMGLSREVVGPSGRMTILQDVSLDISAGESLAIMGPSGSGKSTLVGLLAGLDLPSAGKVEFQDINLGSLDEDGRAQMRAGQVGFVFQSFYLIETLTALENVMLPLELAGHADPRGQGARWLERVGLEGRFDHYPRQLSGGEQQRVAISRAFAIEPKILFADEPTGNLDDAVSDQVAELLFSLCSDRQATLVLVTHDTALAARCQKQLKLRSGRVVAGNG
ncbi:MAG: ABC transporter [Acidiferrobacteraceae bacterium]|nr:ABC transporter [Acidiferrobacteraceae bacterium]MCP4828067.1 ATP-binding cassette domain-containing protein [Pseudomonadota bacterium]HJP07792.1 ATP-binding cassette domain-containing protein [Arenicellales bacterium]